MLVKQREDFDNYQTSVIQDNVKIAFKNYLDLSLSLGLLGSTFLSEGDILTKSYGSYAKKIFDAHPEILGLNIADAHGKIIRVYPENTNSPALGKVTQNYDNLMASWKKGELFWFSSPFQLFQGKPGFVFYVPIVEGVKLKGWFASVLSTEFLYDKFKLPEFFKSYQLIVRDKETNLEYFSSSVSPDESVKIYTSEPVLWGRKLIFQSWSSNTLSNYVFPWYWSALVAFGLSLILVLVLRLIEQKREAAKQLKNIETLLSLTAKEAIGKLADVHQEFNLIKNFNFTQSDAIVQDVTYITHLIEQIDLLQTMARTTDEFYYEDHEILPLIEEKILELKDIIDKKHLKISYDVEALKDVKVCANGWLLKNTVIFNILTHSIIHSEQESTIKIEYMKSDDVHYIAFHPLNIHSQAPDGSPIKIDRRMEVTKKVLHIYQGDINIQKDLSQGMLIRFSLPAST